MIESVTLVTAPEKAVGVRTYADGLAQALTERRVKVSRHAYWKRDLRLAGRNVGAVASPLLGRLAPFPESDVAHATFSNYASRKTGVVTVMDLVWRSGGYPEAAILNKLYKKRIAKGVVICPTQVVAEQVIGWLNVSRDRVFVTHLGKSDVFKVGDPRFVDESKNQIVLMVGDANPRKRTLESVKALEGLKVDLVHVGRPWASTPYGFECVMEAQKRGVHLVQKGVLPDYGLAMEMNNADILLYPSTDEGFGLPPIEAAACGLTSVVGQHPVFDEVMGNVCYKADGRSPESIRHEVRAALASPISENKLTWRAADFQWDFCAAETIRAYEASL